jgi:regulator of protease activity HflC (stomatin/prohibitin superfamily)
LSKLPTFISHQFIIRTSDNVLLELDLRVSYQILDPAVFGMNPIPFQSHIINWAQNELLDMFAKVDLRQFMKAYSTMAIQTIQSGTEYFSNFGISVLDIQVL